MLFQTLVYCADNVVNMVGRAGQVQRGKGHDVFFLNKKIIGIICEFFKYKMTVYFLQFADFAVNRLDLRMKSSFTCKCLFCK